MSEQPGVAIGQNTDSKAINEILQLVCFKLANEEYALEINLIQEVIRVPRITLIPQMPDFCLGVIHSRGNVIPVFDLRKKFCLADKAFDANTRILEANLNNTIVSFVVDEILDNIKFDSSQIDPAPTVKMNIDRKYVKGLGQLDNRMIVILDLYKMHDSILADIGDKNNGVENN